MGYNGWIMLHRKLLSSQMYKALNSKQRDVMMVCLMMANHSENDWQWGAEIFKCAPGQFVTSLDSIRNLCSKDVSVQCLRTSLLKLEKWGFLTNKSTKTGRLITIVKWDTYQGGENETNKDTNGQPTKSQQTSNRQLTSNNNVNNEKNENNTPKTTNGVEVAFGIFWNDYPKKHGKAAALRAWKKMKPPLNKCIVAIADQRTSQKWNKDGGQFIPNPATWINSGCWDDEVQNTPSREQDSGFDIV